MDYVIVQTTACGKAFLPNGDTVAVDHVQYDRKHTHTGQDFEFYVTHFDRQGVAKAAYGFTDEASAWQFVTSTREEGYEIAGQRDPVVRTGLGVADAFITGRVAVIESAPAIPEQSQDI